MGGEAGAGQARLQACGGFIHMEYLHRKAAKAAKERKGFENGKMKPEIRRTVILGSIYSCIIFSAILCDLSGFAVNLFLGASIRLVT